MTMRAIANIRRAPPREAFRRTYFSAFDDTAQAQHSALEQTQ